MADEAKARAEARKQKILAKAASRMAIVTGQVSSMELDSAPVDRPIASRRVKELSTMIPTEGGDNAIEPTENQLISEEELKEKLQESLQKRKEIEAKVISHTEEFDRQNTPETQVQTKEIEVQTSNETIKEVIESTPPNQSLEVIPSQLSINLNRSRLTSKQLRNILQTILIIIFASICGLSHAMDTVSCSSDFTTLANDLSAIDSLDEKRKKLVEYVNSHYEETAASSTCPNPSLLMTFFSHPILSLIIAWNISASLVSFFSLMIPLQEETQKTTFFSSLVSIVLSGTSGMIEILVDLLGQISFHIIVTIWTCHFFTKIFQNNYTQSTISQEL